MCTWDSLCMIIQLFCVHLWWTYQCTWTFMPLLLRVTLCCSFFLFFFPPGLDLTGSMFCFLIPVAARIDKDGWSWSFQAYCGWWTWVEEGCFWMCGHIAGYLYWSSESFIFYHSLPQIWFGWWVVILLSSIFHSYLIYLSYWFGFLWCSMTFNFNV